MERGSRRGCSGDRLSARGAEEVSAASVKAVIPLDRSSDGRPEGTGDGGGIDGRLEQVGPKQGRGFPECSARGIRPKSVCGTADWVAFLPGEPSVTWLPQEARVVPGASKTALSSGRAYTKIARTRRMWWGGGIRLSSQCADMAVRAAREMKLRELG